LKGDGTIEVRIELLLYGQLDVAADGKAAHIFGPAVGRLHDARAAACHDGKTQLRQSSADLPGELVVGVTFGKPRRAKNRDAGTDKVQRAKAPNELSRDPEDREELAAPRPRTFEENPLRRRTGRYVLLPAATEMRALASSARSRKPLSVSRLAVFIASLA